MARPVESNVVISSSERRPSGQHGAEVRHFFAPERARAHGICELAVVARLLPVVASRQFATPLLRESAMRRI